MGMREYETIFILKPDLPEDALERVSGKVEKALDELKGVLLVRENWGKKKLAYDIAKCAKGNYVFYHYLGEGGLVAEIERNLKIDDAVLRYMTVKVDEEVEPEARLKAIAERPRTSSVSLVDDDDAPRRDRRDRGGDRDRGHDRGMDRFDDDSDRDDEGDDE